MNNTNAAYIVGNGPSTTAEREFSAYDINMDHWRAKKPFGISGCIRVRNEAQFMRASVESFLPYLDEIVLITQPSEDNTVELARQLAAEYDIVRVAEYPVIPAAPLTDEHINTPVDSIHSFVYLSNWALAQCRYSWICKVEGDVVALSTFAQVREQIEANPDAHRYYGMVILNVAGVDGTMFSATNPRNAGWDEAVFNNDGSWYFIKNGKWETIQHGEYAGDNVNVGWQLIHLKRCKDKHLGRWNGEVYMSLTRGNLAGALGNYNRRSPYPGPDDPFGIDELFDWRLR